MPTYVAFLRAINLGARRKFPKDDVKRVVESVGATGVQTHLNTGNVLLTTTMRSPSRVGAALEKAFAADRGFEVPTMVFTTAELVEVADAAERLRAELGEPRAHYISLFKAAPPEPAVAAVHDLRVDGEVVRVVDRAAHVLLQVEFHDNRVLASKEFRALGEGTARNVTVIRALAARWGG